MALERLVTDYSAFAEQWERDVVCSRNLGDFSDLFTAESAEEIVGRGLRLPFVRLIQEGKELDPAHFTRPLVAGRTDDAMVLADAVQKHVAAGMTLAIGGVQQCWPPLARYCRELAKALGIDMHAGLYLSPPRSRGAGPHYDVMSVFIRQVEGYKCWQVREPSTWWPTKKWEEGMPADTPVVLETTLQPGDCLYIPRGFIHDGWTEEDGSLHITFSGTKPVTWVDVLRREVSKQGKKQVQLRGTLPLRPHERPAVLQNALAEVIADLQRALGDIDVEALAKELAERVRPRSGDNLSAQPLTESLRRRPEEP